MIRIEPGNFMIGSSNGDPDEMPVHQVTISKPFLLGKYEVTQAEWRSIMGTNPSHFLGDDLPVDNVSWKDCQELIRMLNTRTGGGWRLPTEAEWEYACRAGTIDDYAGVLDEMAWYEKNSGYTTHPVGQKRPNAWGLYDMHGNVWEWCQDWEGAYSLWDVPNPVGPSSGLFRVIRGGNWKTSAAKCRSAEREWNSPGFRSYSLGLRLARNIQ
jgi:formylglycine-generating enzyme required for sulfatase activity